MLIESEALEGLSSMAVGLIERLFWMLMEWIYCIFHNVCWLLPRYCKARQEPHSCWTQIGTVAVSEVSPVCTAVQGVGLPAGKLTMWSIICDKGLVGEASRMALHEMDCLWVLQQITPLLWCAHGLVIGHDFRVRSYGLPVTWLCKLIYVKLYCSNLYEVNKGCLQHEGVDNLFPSAIKRVITREELSRYCQRRKDMWENGDSSSNQRVSLGYGRVHRFRWKPIVWQLNCQYLGGGKETCMMFTRSRGGCSIHCYRAHNKGWWSCQCSVLQEVLPHWNHSTCTWPAM